MTLGASSMDSSALDAVTTLMLKRSERESWRSSPPAGSVPAEGVPIVAARAIKRPRVLSGRFAAEPGEHAWRVPVDRLGAFMESIKALQKSKVNRLQIVMLA